MNYFELGKRIKIARLAANMTQEVLAERVNLSSGHIAHVECATTKVSLKALVDIANTLDTTPDKLLTDSSYSVAPQLLSEAEILFADCNPDEIYVMLKAAEAIKHSIRVRKLNRTE